LTAKAKRAYVSILSALGLVVLLVGLFTDAYPFTTSLIIAIVCWIASGILAKFWEVKK
jgi:uncharacterized membrane protein